MKILAACVLWVCVAGAVASSILLPLAKQSAGKQVSGAGKAASQFRDVAQVQNKAQNSVAGNKNIGLVKQYKDDSSSKSAAARQDTAADYAQKSANWDAAANDVAQSGHKASSAASSQKASRKNAASQAAVQDNLWSAQRNFKNSNHRGDKIDYAYDKKFDLNDNQNGAYVYAQDSNANARDNFYDRSSAYDRNVDNFAASASAADKQSNDRSSQAKQSNAANQAARDKFGRDAANSNQLWANQRAFNKKLDSSNQAKQQAGVGKNYASGFNQGNYQRDSNYKRNDAAAKQLGYGTGYPVAQGAALSPYYAKANYYGPSSNYGPSANYGPSSFFPDTGLNYGKAAGAQDYANAHDYGANSQLQNRGTYNLQDFSVSDFNKGLWTNDQFQSQGNNQASAYSDQGFSDKANNAAQNADRYGRDWAAADAARNQDQKVANFNEDAKFQENDRKVSTDRNQNNRVYQNYYNNDNKNGNNWERLKYNRDQDDDVHGFDNQMRRDKAFKDVKQAENFDQSQNAKQADAASANEAASQKQFQDWQRAAAGHQSQQAASDNKAADARKGQDDSVWKYDQEQKMADNYYQQQLAKDQGTNYYNDGANYVLAGKTAPGYSAGNNYLGNGYPAWW